MGGTDARVAVIGLGAMGSNALWRLAERGVEAIGIEQFAAGHDRGSSHGDTRLFRTVCLEHPGLVPLARRAAELWRELEERTGTHLLELTGGLTIGAPDSPLVTATRQAAEVNGERLAEVDLATEFPQHRPIAPGHIALRDENAGVVRPERGVTAACQAAERAGAQTVFGSRVREVTPDEDGVLVRTTDRDYRVEQVVLTTGAWLRAFAPGIPLEPFRTPQTWFTPRADPEAFAVDRFPTFIRQFDDGPRMWGHGGMDGGDPKCGPADNPAYPPADPDALDRRVRPEDRELIGSLVRRGIEGLDPEPSRVTICMYTKTPDEQFVLGRIGDRVVLGGGGSGHAFKHATALGEALADTVTGEPSFTDLSFVDPKRFG
ncbi:N-methyl-L-tryptophan oxidase [Sciscionella sediminilitoris]|uniref:N-methyl-L-tryptophan oxidase n=1 Tax=Sciscionella sediminilitoris TaxID=1445613 RepID=UPI0004DEFA88|nr:N-methyl-L-tryptophan oxidase [Sciscionella sp. SE31]